MKKLFMALAICLMVAGTVRAELNVGKIIENLPPLKQGIAYSLTDNEINYLSTIEIAKWKGFCLEAGYSSKDKVVGVASYELLKLKDIIDLPILNLVEFNLGVYAGYGRIGLGAGNAKENNEFDWGASITLVKVKF